MAKKICKDYELLPGLCLLNQLGDKLETISALAVCLFEPIKKISSLTLLASVLALKAQNFAASHPTELWCSALEQSWQVVHLFLPSQCVVQKAK